MYQYNHHLNNEKLRNIDPHSDSLTLKEKRMILMECKTNFDYFMNILFFNKKESKLLKIYKEIINGGLKW